MLNLDHQTTTGSQFFHRSDVAMAPPELNLSYPFSLSVERHKQDASHIVQEIEGESIDGHKLRALRNGKKGLIRSPIWGGWIVSIITKDKEIMNVKAMTDAEIEMNISRLWAEQTERTIKKVMAETTKPEPAPASEMVVVINNVPHKVDLSEAFKKFKPSGVVETTIKMANEQEFNELLAEIAEQDAGRIMPIPPLSEEGIEKAAVEAHLAECKECRIEHVGKLGYALFEINQLIAKHTHPDALKALEKEKQGIQREINKYMAM